MRVAIVVLSTFAVAMCAPTGEKADELEINSDDIRVKRAKEVMMYGNQQNEQQSSVKRASPADNVDENGYIIANEASNLDPEETENSNEAEELVSSNDETNESNIEDNAEIDNQEIQETDTAEQDSIETTDKDTAETDTALEPVKEDNDENEDEMSVEEYLKELEKLRDDDSDEDMAPYLNLLKDTTFPYWNQDPYRYYNNYNSPYGNFQRYRRSQVRNMKDMKFPMLKRSHRVKRQAYYLPDVDGYLPYDDRILNTPYNNYPVTEEDLAELLDVLDDSKPYDDDIYMSPYEEYQPYEEANDIEFDSPIYLPKRQSLSFVPGIKRNRDFFPYFKEPDSHFQAFVPDKRSLREEAEAYDAYERVMALAAALRQQNYYPGEYFEGYRRRK